MRVSLLQRHNFKSRLRDLPGGPAVKTSLSSAGGTGLIPGRGTKKVPGT